MFAGDILFWALKVQENFQVFLDAGGPLNLYLPTFPPKHHKEPQGKEEQIKPPLTYALSIIEDKEYYKFTFI